MSVITRFGASSGVPHWRTSTAKESLDDDEDTRKSSRFIEDEAQSSGDDEDDDQDDADSEGIYAGPLLSTHEQLIYYSSGQNPQQRARQLLKLEPNSVDIRMANITYTNALRKLEDLAVRPQGDSALFAVTDSDLTAMILDAFITLDTKVSGESDQDSDNNEDMEDNEDTDKDDDDDDDEAINNLASRVFDVIENVNATRASRPKLNRAPFSLEMALAALPEYETLIADQIRQVMDSLWSYSESEHNSSEDDNDDDETADVEQIIEDRVTDGIREYLVKWEDFDDSFNTWLTVEELADYPMILRDYYDETRDPVPPSVAKLIKQHHRKGVQERRRRTRVYSSDDES